jgi:hypothetical protein
MRRQNVRLTKAQQAPFFVGIDVGKRTHDAAMVDAHGSACWPQTLQCAHTRQGSMQVQAP